MMRVDHSGLLSRVTSHGWSFKNCFKTAFGPSFFLIKFLFFLLWICIVATSKAIKGKKQKQKRQTLTFEGL